MVQNKSGHFIHNNKITPTHWMGNKN